MSNNRIVHFKANAAVKDIVGRGLIYDDNVAIIELVKNARDAEAPKAIIRFTNEALPLGESSITISDNGKGMSFDDIANKWLNIAYSEKKGNLLKNRSPYAGNKGVGRFSCDRLGSELCLYTKSETGDYLKLHIDWELFEDKAQDDEISSIDLQCEVLDKKSFLEAIGDKNFEHGTILKIANLRSEWSSRKLKKLVAELEKFSPSLDADFEVYLYSETPYSDPYLKDKLNKRINNNILEKISFKTTYIKSSVSSDGNTISTTLYYQGAELYSYTAENPYASLKNISMEVHYLDALSKSYFTRVAGINPNEYGSIFLFYNGFRVSPYGNDKNDWLSLDQRKSQGTARYLGTREVFGRIDINDNDNVFSVITSREGLAHNNAFFDLVAFDQDEKTVLKNGKESYGYAITIVRQLENFVVNGLDWNRIIDRLSPKDPDNKKVINISDIQREPARYELKPISADKVKEACDRILKSDLKIVDFKINDDLILRISDVAEEKYQQFVDDFVEKTKNKTLNKLSSRDKGFISQIVGEERAKTQAAKEERDYAEQKLVQVEKKVEVEQRRSSFLETLASPERTLDALITHVMKQISGGIETDVKSILSIYYKDPQKVSKEEFVEILEDVVMDLSIIKESATMATKADFNLKVSAIKEDLYGFIEDYIREIASKNQKWGIKVRTKNGGSFKRNQTFNPAEVCVLITNVLDNSRKSGSKSLLIDFTESSISFSDDGKGFDFEAFEDKDFIRKGITTTSGSGLGLYHSNLIADHLGAKLILSNNPKSSGALVTLEFSK